MKIKYLVILLLVAVVVFIIGAFPAQLVFDHINQEEIKARHIRGTVWNGSAERMMINGIMLDKVTWDIAPLDILKSRLAYKVTTKKNHSQISGRLIKWTDRQGMENTRLKIYLADTISAIPVQYRFLVQPVVRGGFISGNIAEAVADDDRRIINLTGLLELHELKLMVGKVKGVYSAKITTEKGVVKVEFGNSPGADLQLSGFITLASNGKYNININLAAHGNTPDAIKKRLGTNGIKIKLDGKIKMNFFSAKES